MSAVGKSAVARSCPHCGGPVIWDDPEEVFRAPTYQDSVLNNGRFSFMATCADCQAEYRYWCDGLGRPAIWQESISGYYETID